MFFETASATKPKITIGIVIYDEVARIKKLIDSFPAATSDRFECNWIFILNHQDTELRTLIKKFLTQLLPNATCIENPSNNIAIARNLILQNCQTTWLYFTDPDIDQSAQSLNLILEKASTNKIENIVGFGGPVLYKSTNFVLQKTYDFFSNIMRFLPLSFLIQNHPSEKVVDHIPTCHMLLKKDFALQVGAFNAAYELFGEDLELTHRLANQKFNFLFVPQAYVIHWQNISLTKHLLKMFHWGQVQISSTYDNWSTGIRWYRLFPLFILITILSLLCLAEGFILQIFILLFLMLSFFLPGFYGATLSFLAYALGELAQTIFLWKKIKNANQSPANNLVSE